MSPMLLPASGGSLTTGGLCACPLISGEMAIHCTATSANAANIFKQPLVSSRTRVFVMEILLADFATLSRNGQNVNAFASRNKFRGREILNKGVHSGAGIDMMRN